ncbi:hypothetical protein TNCT_629961 [Trichonephila clavata]|uniref:Uncharacterized protein n=1 Tax=Trichonephila clavata TaxID=2740835 RepID=A0A8X6GIX2_TRICU|nr:hypothetical protein TNCT_629961 [Trichonephila clavata]
MKPDGKEERLLSEGHKLNLRHGYQMVEKSFFTRTESPSNSKLIFSRLSKEKSKNGFPLPQMLLYRIGLILELLSCMLHSIDLLPH